MALRAYIESVISRASLPVAVPITFIFVLIIISSYLYCFMRSQHCTYYYQNIPLVNRRSVLEPRMFSRLRWAFNAAKIMEDAEKYYPDQPFRVDRGDTDVLVLPARYMAELNKLSQDMTNSRAAHYFSLVGYLNGLDAVQETSTHIKMLLGRATPAIPQFFEPISKRIESTLDTEMPKVPDEWHTIAMLDPLLACITQVISLLSFGHQLCDSPKLIEFCNEHAINAFTITFLMRLLPRFLQPMLVWLLPQKWRLERSMRTLQRIVIPEVRKRSVEQRNNPNVPVEPDFISWLLVEAKKEEMDAVVLTRLIGAIIAGGTWSTAGYILGVLLDIVNHPGLLEEIREEIRTKDKEVRMKPNGKWDQNALNSLDKLDSAMKETGRLRTATVFVYSRVMQQDYVTSDGLLLKKGQLITTSSHSTARDPTKFQNPQDYDGLRSYNENLELHRAQPFRTVEPTGHRWGSGRWACPGRFITSLASKLILIKLLDQYDFQFSDGQMPKSWAMHEFGFIKPDMKIRVKKRK